MRLTLEEFEILPDEVQEQARDHLKAFDECLIIFEYGKYHVGGGACVKAEYAPDHKVYGYIAANDIYTPEERICNYIESFNDYPIQYKGSRDYKMLQWLHQIRIEGHEIPIRLINGTAMPPALGRFCFRCDSRVWISELEDYAYQCFECDEDLFSFEVINRSVVEGTKVDTGFFGPGFCDGSCGECMEETFNIPSNRVSKCAHCSAELFPCAACETSENG